jgi:5,10-methylenetetrahydromethanopterin reductase
VEISCAFPPGPHVVDHIVEAERLGYERAWLFDSPALYGDIWVIAALAAQRTSRIALGPAVLVPNLRHPLTQAAAIATAMRPGASCSRVAIALACVSGWRRFGTSTAGPIAMRDVRCAANAAITQMSP